MIRVNYKIDKGSDLNVLLETYLEMFGKDRTNMSDVGLALPGFTWNPVFLDNDEFELFKSKTSSATAVITL